VRGARGAEGGKMDAKEALKKYEQWSGVNPLGYQDSDRVAIIVDLYSALKSDQTRIEELTAAGEMWRMAWMNKQSLPSERQGDATEEESLLQIAKAIHKGMGATPEWNEETDADYKRFYMSAAKAVRALFSQDRKKMIQEAADSYCRKTWEKPFDSVSEAGQEEALEYAEALLPLFPAQETPFETDEECPECKGKGVVNANQPGWPNHTVPCASCGGSYQRPKDWSPAGLDYTRGTGIITRPLTPAEVAEWAWGMRESAHNTMPVEACPECGAEPGCNIDCPTCDFIHKWHKNIDKALLLSGCPIRKVPG